MNAKRFVWLAGLAMLAGSATAVPVVSNVHMKQIDGTKQVEITYDLADTENEALRIDVSVTTNGVALPVEAVSGDVADSVTPGKGKRVVWDAGKDWGGRYTEIAKAKVTATRMTNWCIVDLSGGSDAETYPVEFLSAPPADGWSKKNGWTNDIYKTTKLVLREIPAGTFLMGCPLDEVGGSQSNYETQHKVTLTKPYYIGVFEVTQTQYWLMTGKGIQGRFPVGRVSYAMVCGEADGALWPASDAVDSESILGQLRAKTGLLFDLPTEAQWEYACRAGTKTALNNGTNLRSSTSSIDDNLSGLGCYAGNSKGNGTRPVGSYQPNAWGLYDMHGNVLEWCRDWYGGYFSGAVTDPKGQTSGVSRTLRGGYYNSYPSGCRSASRSANLPTYDSYTYYGFRLVLSAGY